MGLEKRPFGPAPGEGIASFCYRSEVTAQASFFDPFSSVKRIEDDFCEQQKVEGQPFISIVQYQSNRREMKGNHGQKGSCVPSQLVIYCLCFTV